MKSSSNFWYVLHNFFNRRKTPMATKYPVWHGPSPSTTSWSTCPPPRPSHPNTRSTRTRRNNPFPSRIAFSTVTYRTSTPSHSICRNSHRMSFSLPWVISICCSTLLRWICCRWGSIWRPCCRQSGRRMRGLRWSGRGRSIGQRWSSWLLLVRHHLPGKIKSKTCF